MNARFHTTRLAAVVALAALSPFPAKAQEPSRQDLRTVMAELARSVKAVVEKENHRSVRVGVFSPLGLDDSNAGAAITAALAAELAGFVDPKALLEVQGGYGFVEDKNGLGVKVVKVRAKIIDTTNLEEKKAFLLLEGTIAHNTDIARLLGITGPLNPNGNRVQRNREIQQRQQDPAVHIPTGDGPPFIASNPASPYAVEVRVKPLHAPPLNQPAQPRKAEPRNGQAFVPIGRDELYEVRILNRSQSETAVTLAIDGLDVFTFSEDKNAQGLPRFTHFIVPAAANGKPGEVLIPGWHKTADPQRKDNFLSFLVTEYGRGAASKFPTKSQGKVGVITVTFAHSFPKDLPAGLRSANAETGFGPPREVKQEVLERVIDPPHEIISVRYLRESTPQKGDLP